MSASKTFFLISYALIAFIGLLTWGKAEDLALMIFGALLMAFGALLAYRTIGRHYDESGTS